MESKKILLSEELNKFKDKLAQNWFINYDKNNFIREKDNSKILTNFIIQNIP